MTTIKEALEPFAKEADRYDDGLSDKAVVRYSATARYCNLTLGDLRRARAALADIEGAGKEGRTHGETWAKIADKAADAIGVTPSSDMRTHVKAAVIWALAAALSPASQGIEREKSSPAPVGDIAGLVERLRAMYRTHGQNIAFLDAAEALSRMEEREKELCEGLSWIAQRADSGGRRLETAMTACEEIECRARNLLAGKESGKSSPDDEKTKYLEAIRGLLMEWDKFTRYGSPIAKAANERVAAARKLLEGG